MLGITLMMTVALAGGTGPDGADAGPRPAGEPAKHYTLRDRDNGGGFALRVGDTLDVKLPVQLGNGFSWRVAEDHPSPLPQDGAIRIENNPQVAGNIVGQRQDQVFRFRADRTVKDRIVLEKVGPGVGRKPVEKFSVTIEVR